VGEEGGVAGAGRGQHNSTAATMAAISAGLGLALGLTGVPNPF
jgi:hypothetical protein